MKNKIKTILRVSGDAASVFFMLSLLGVAVYMVLRKEEMAEKLGTVAYAVLLIASIARVVYHRI